MWKRASVTQIKLPVVLRHEPLVDAVFEVRFQNSPPLADMLPGYLFAELEPKPVLSRLPAANIPYPMRANDPNLQFAPTQRLEWGDYFIALGDQNIVISCKLPYPKWPSFKSTILYIINVIAKAGIAGQIERYALKYVNLIPASDVAEQIKKIQMEIKLGDIQVDHDHMSLQVHRNEGDILHIMSVIIGAQGKMPDGESVDGAVIDIDSIRTINAPDLNALIQNLDQSIEELRYANKVKFFSCLTDAAIKEMEPEYE